MLIHPADPNDAQDLDSMADHENPELITRQAMMRIKEQIDDTNSYFNLLQFMIFLVLYMLVLYSQIGVDSGGRELKMR